MVWFVLHKTLDWYFVTGSDPTQSFYINLRMLKKIHNSVKRTLFCFKFFGCLRFIKVFEEKLYFLVMSRPRDR